MSPYHSVLPCTNLLPNLGVYWQFLEDEKRLAASQGRAPYFTALQLVEEICSMGPFEEDHYFYGVDCESLGAQCAMILSEIDAAAGVRGLRSVWVTHPEFAVVEQAKVNILGHPWHLREVAAGWTKAVSHAQWFAQLAIRKFGGRLVTTPMAAIKKVGAFAEPWVRSDRNKHMSGFENPNAKNAAHVYMLHRHQYLDPTHDLYSIRDYVPFFSRAIPLEWRLPLADVFVRVLAVNPLDALKRDAPDADAHINDESALIIDGEPYGSLVWLMPDERGRYTGLYTGDSVERTLPGIKITRGYYTACKRQSCGKGHPILEPNQIWSTGAFDLPGSCSDVQWTETRLQEFTRRLFAGLTRRRRLIATGKKSVGMPEMRSEMAIADLGRSLDLQASHSLAELRTAEVTQDLRAEREFHDQVGRWLQGRIPSGQLEAVIHGSFRATECKLLVLFGDLVKFSLWAETRDSEAVIGMLDRVHQSFRRLVNTHGGIVPKGLGDGFMAYFLLDPEDPMPEGVVSAALSAAKVFHEVLLKEEDMEARFGIHSGSAHIGLIDGVLDIAGTRVNEAARFESLAEDGRTVISLNAALLGLPPTVRKLSRDMKEGNTFHVGKHELRYIGPRSVKHGLVLHACELTAQDDGKRPSWIAQVLFELETSEMQIPTIPEVTE